MSRKVTSAGSSRRSAQAFGCRRAFTLVELMLVMALLSIIVSVSLPSLSNFFHGRTLESEARRLLALTRSAQNRAVSEGVPVIVWVNTEGRRYGMKEEPGWVDTDPKAVEFSLDSELKLEVINLTPANPPSARNKSLAGALVDLTSNLPGIRFLPDGSFEENNLTAVRILQGDNSLWLAKTRNLLNYEIRSQFN